VILVGVVSGQGSLVVESWGGWKSVFSSARAASLVFLFLLIGRFPYELAWVIT
jgi:hypothetical protein